VCFQAKGLTSLGMPCYRGSGSLAYRDDKYRFLVMDRFGNDLQKIFQSGNKLFSGKVSFNLALKILDVLEYIHSKGYVHNDIKAQNLLLGYGRTKENDVYLVDFGLVSTYLRDGIHVEYKPDARKAHDGTIEYTSRDAHIGAHSRRSGAAMDLYFDNIFSEKMALNHTTILCLNFIIALLFLAILTNFLLKICFLENQCATTFSAYVHEWL
jgi:serine/threonine protein kinase